MSVSGLDKQHAMLMAVTDSNLNGAAKAVFCVLIDHYNLETGLCFPSIDLLAVEANLSDRSVRRAAQDLKRANWIDWVRYGGPGHTNLYEINWKNYETAKSAYEARQHAYRDRITNTNNLDGPVRQPGPSRPDNPDSLVLQTLEVNQEKNLEDTQAAPSFENDAACTWGGKPSDSKHVGKAAFAKQASDRVGTAERPSHEGRRAKTNRHRRSSSVEVASLKAEQRWHQDFNEHFRGSENYAPALAALTSEIEEAATAAEVKERGQGVATVMEQLRDALDTQGAVKA